jgi:hypothetical protein
MSHRTWEGTSICRRTAIAAAMFYEDLTGEPCPMTASPRPTRYSKIVVARRRVDNPIVAFAALIVATALSAEAGVAIIDIGGFDGGVLIWSTTSGRGLSHMRPQPA